jgi:hypothetical protein
MRTMFRFSRLARRFVAGAAAVLFLACQGTAMVYARSAGAPGSDAAQGSCHDPGQQAGKTATNNACQANCQSQLTSSGFSGAGVLSAADVAAITTRIDRTVSVADSAPPFRSPLLQIEPPPLTILHCCLRN